MVQTLVRAKAIVQSEGQLVVTDPALHFGEAVEVLIWFTAKRDEKYRPATDILNDLEGHRLFQSAEEVEQYIREERESWDF